MEKNHKNQEKEIKRRSTFSVLFYINRTKVRKDGTCQLLCKISIDGQAAQFGVKASIAPSLWEPETGRATGRSANALEVNRAIGDLTEQIEGHYRAVRKNLGFVTAELVKNAVLGIAQHKLTLLALFREHNEEFRKRVGVDRVEETYMSYVNSYNHLAAFVWQRLREREDTEARDDIALRALDKTFYEDFELFLCTECGMMPKTVHEHLYRLKKMTRRAVSQGTLRRDPYGKDHPALPERKSRHLKHEDLKRLLEQGIDKPNLQRVRDWFIFATFTGLAYADLRRLSEKDITRDADGTSWIHIRRKKSETPSAIRLLDVPLRIIEKYRPERKGDKIFNLYSRTYLIRLTRELGRAYGIDMTFHMGRHNFGTHITLSLGVPIETVSRMMGHKSIGTTQIYAKVTDRKVDEDMKRLKKRIGGREINLYEEETSETGKKGSRKRRAI